MTYSVIEMKNEQLFEICKLVFITDTFIKKEYDSIRKFLKKCCDSTKSETIKKYLNTFLETHKTRLEWMA